MATVFSTTVMKANHFVGKSRNHRSTRRSTLGVTIVKEVTRLGSTSTTTPVLVVDLAKVSIVVNSQFFISSTGMLRNVDGMIECNGGLIVDFQIPMFLPWISC